MERGVGEQIAGVVGGRFGRLLPPCASASVVAGPLTLRSCTLHPAEFG